MAMALTQPRTGTGGRMLLAAGLGAGALLASAGGVALAQGIELSAMVDACQRFMGSLGVSPEALRGLMAGCMGPQ